MSLQSSIGLPGPGSSIETHASDMEASFAQLQMLMSQAAGHRVIYIACMHICIHIYMYIYIYWLRTCTAAFTCECIMQHICIHMSICMHTHWYLPRFVSLWSFVSPDLSL